MVAVDCTIRLCITLLEWHPLLLNHTKTQRQENNLQYKYVRNLYSLLQTKFSQNGITREIPCF